MSAGDRLPGTPEPMHIWRVSGGLRIAGDSWGDVNGPLVILQHGGGQTRHSWKRTGELLGAAGYFVVAFDARGHGDSDWALDGAYDQDLLVQDLKCVVSALGGRRPALVGASRGGTTNMIAVGEDRLDASALVLVDIAPVIDEGGVSNIDVFMRQKPEGFVSLEEAAEAIAAYQPHRKRRNDPAGLAKNLRLGPDGRYRWHWDPRYRDRPEKFALAQRQIRLEGCARRLTLPTLLVRGALSDLLTESGAQAFLRLCPHAEYINIADTAHMVAGDRNDAFGGATLDFLSRVVPVGSSPIQSG